LVWDKTLADRRRKAPKEVERVVEDLLMRQRMAIPVPEPLEPMTLPNLEGILLMMLNFLILTVCSRYTQVGECCGNAQGDGYLGHKLGKGMSTLSILHESQLNN
jgi:hypothetical protein